MEPDEIRTNFQSFETNFPPNASHPANIMLRAAFELRIDGVDEIGHNWDEASAGLLDRAYIAGFGDYIARSPVYKSYRRRLGNDSVRLSPIEWIIRHKVDWSEIVSLLGIDRPNQITATDLLARADNIAQASRSIRDVCGVTRGEGPISFCSKYAFFVNGIAPIIDSNAEIALRRMNVGYPKTRGTYHAFVDAFTKLLGIIYPGNTDYTSDQIKNLDGYLYEAGRGRWALGEDVQP